MSRIIDFIEDHWKKLLCVLAIIIAIVLAVIFIPKYTGPSEECVFIAEITNLHNEYTIKVDDVAEYEQIDVLLNSDDTEKITRYSNTSHYLAVTLTIKRTSTTKPKEDHVFDKNDFKLKDHTGVKIKNVYFTGKSGMALSEKSFSTTNSYVDYSYIGKSIALGEEKTSIIYFEIQKGLSVFEHITVLEVDFFVGNGTKSGTDIVLAQRTV